MCRRSPLAPTRACQTCQSNTISSCGPTTRGDKGQNVGGQSIFAALTMPRAGRSCAGLHQSGRWCATCCCTSQPSWGNHRARTNGLGATKQALRIRRRPGLLAMHCPRGAPRGEPVLLCSILLLRVDVLLKRLSWIDRSPSLRF